MRIEHEGALDPQTVASVCSTVDELCRELSPTLIEGEDPLMRARVSEIKRGSLILEFVFIALNGMAESNPAGFAVATNLLSSGIVAAITFSVAKASGETRSPPGEAPKGAVRAQKLVALALDPSVRRVEIEGGGHTAAFDRNELQRAYDADAGAFVERAVVLLSKHVRIVAVANGEWRIWLEFEGKEIKAWTRAPPTPAEWTVTPNATIVADLRVTTFGAEKSASAIDIMRVLWRETQEFAEPKRLQ